MSVSQSYIFGDGFSRHLRALRERMFRRGRGRVRQPGPSRRRTEVGRGEIRPLEPAQSAGLEETATRVQNVLRPSEGGWPDTTSPFPRQGENDRIITGGTLPTGDVALLRRQLPRGDGGRGRGVRVFGKSETSEPRTAPAGREPGRENVRVARRGPRDRVHSRRRHARLVRRRPTSPARPRTETRRRPSRRRAGVTVDNIYRINNRKLDVRIVSSYARTRSISRPVMTGRYPLNALRAITAFRRRSFP